MPVPQGAPDVLKRSQQARLQLDEIQKKMAEPINNFALARGLDESAFLALLGAGCGDNSFEGSYARQLNLYEQAHLELNLGRVHAGPPFSLEVGDGCEWSG